MLRNISINLVSQGYLFLLSFLTIPLILHGLGKEQFGLLVLASALLNYATTFDFGFGAALTQKIAQIRVSSQRRDLASFIQTTFLFYCLLALLVAISLNLFRPFILGFFHLSPALQIIGQQIFPIVALNTGLYFLTIYTGAVFQGLERFFLYNIRTFIVGTANTAGIALLVSAHYPLVAVFQLQTIALLITIAISIWFVRSYLAYPRFSRRHLADLSSFAIFKFFSNSAGQINNQFPKFFLASFANIASVSYFTVPFSLVQKLGVILSQAYIVIFPKVSNLHGEKRYAHIGKLFLKGEVAIAIFMAVVTLLGFLLGPWFLNWWLKDPEFTGHIIPIFNILLIVYLIHALTAIPVAILEGLGNAKIPAILAWVNTAIVIFLGPFLIKNFQAQGAAWLILSYTLISAPAVIALALSQLRKK